MDKVAADTDAVEKAQVDQGFKNAVVAHGERAGIGVEVVERAHGILMLHRRLVRDYEHLPRSSQWRVDWAMTAVILRRPTGATGLHVALSAGAGVGGVVVTHTGRCLNVMARHIRRRPGGFYGVATRNVPAAPRKWCT
ncbi:hypothetical protein [Streptomyces erythrochromogenes]|uniref:hypothetical protein n=1 Tax=Streptomyces erythrochromogenes TaxID=285574 RepID=UPI003682BB84